MPDTTITKIDSTHSPKGSEGQKYLACGTSMSMRLWENESVNQNKEDTKHEYETLGFVIKGKAELHLEGQMVILNKGDSWVVPKGASHHYKILEEFSAVETTSPPAELHDRAKSGKTDKNSCGETSANPQEFAEATAKDSAAVKTATPAKGNSPEMQAKANTEATNAAVDENGAAPDKKDGKEGKIENEKATVKDKNCDDAKACDVKK